MVWEMIDLNSHKLKVKVLPTHGLADDRARIVCYCHHCLAAILWSVITRTVMTILCFVMIRVGKLSIIAHLESI